MKGGAPEAAQDRPPPGRGAGASMLLMNSGVFDDEVPDAHLKKLQYALDHEEEELKSIRQFARLHSAVDTGKEQSELEREQLREEVMEELSQTYQLGSFLGSGNSAEVFMAYDIKELKTVAMKIIEVDPDDEEIRNVVQREVYFAQANINHDNLVRTNFAFNIMDYFFVVMEFMSGGSLEDTLKDVGRLPEEATKVVMRSLLTGLDHLHMRDLVHRDIKPANIMLPFRGALEVKLSDFGLCEELREDDKGRKRLKGMYGTPYYVAPEIVRDGRYDTRVDLWSCGVVMYELLSGSRPFEGETTVEVLKKVKKAHFRFSAPVWKYVSSNAKKLITKLLTPDYKRRPRADEALSHRWFGPSEEGTDFRHRKNLSSTMPDLSAPTANLLY